MQYRIWRFKSFYCNAYAGSKRSWILRNCRCGYPGCGRFYGNTSEKWLKAFRKLCRKEFWTLEHAEEIGLGSRVYALVDIDK